MFKSNSNQRGNIMTTSEIQDLIQEYEGEVRHDMQLALQPAYDRYFDSLKRKGTDDSQAKQESISYVENTFHLQPGSFRPIVKGSQGLF
jgi:hypothetical protein